MHLAGQLGAFHQNADFAVPQDRARVEIERADEDFFLIEHRRLAVQAGLRFAEKAVGRFLLRLPAQFEQADPELQHPLAVGRVAAMHRRNVGGFQRIGQDANDDAGTGPVGQVVDAAVGRYEIGGDQRQLLADRLHGGSQLGGQQQGGSRHALGQQFFRRVPHGFAGRPDQFLQPLLQLRTLLVLH